MLTQTILAVSLQFFTVTHHAAPWGLAQAQATQFNTGVVYQLDEHYEVGDTVLVLYDDDVIVSERKFDLYKRY